MSRIAPRPAAGLARLAATCFVTGAALCGCNGANPVAPRLPVDNPHEWLEQSRPLSGVQALVLDLGFLCNLRIEQGTSESIWIRADETVLPFFETKVRAGVLTLRYPFDVDPSKRPPKTLEIVLTVTDLASIELRDNSTVTTSRLSVDRLSLRSSGSGMILLSGLAAAALEVEIQAGGGVEVSGAVDRQNVLLTGLGGYDGRDLASREADIEISNAGSATVRVSDRLGATIRGSGSVFYLGDPVVESFISGSGQVVRLGD
jgi:hypothetical protein